MIDTHRQHERPRLVSVAGGAATIQSETRPFTRGCALQMVSGDTDALAFHFGVASFCKLPRLVRGLVSAVAFGRITPEEMVRVMRAVVDPIIL